MKQQRGVQFPLGLETEDTDAGQRPVVHSVAMVTAAAELGLLPTTTFELRTGKRRPSGQEKTTIWRSAKRNERL
jgi:hypothetical protein